MARFDLTDFACSVIQPLLPNKVRGVKRRDDRLMLSAGHAYDGHAAEKILAALPEGCRLLAGRAYDSNAIRALSVAKGTILVHSRTIAPTSG